MGKLIATEYALTCDKSSTRCEEGLRVFEEDAKRRKRPRSDCRIFIAMLPCVIFNPFRTARDIREPEFPTEFLTRGHLLNARIKEDARTGIHDLKHDAGIPSASPHIKIRAFLGPIGVEEEE